MVSAFVVEKFLKYCFPRFWTPQQIMTKTCFRASLELQGPRDPPCVKERKTIIRIALTRALYDQMAPQLCPFYVPGKLSFSSLVFALIFSAFLMSGKHLPEERNTPIGPIHIVFLLGPTQTSFSFPPAGTPEATSTSWEQEQMARPHVMDSVLMLQSYIPQTVLALRGSYLFSVELGMISRISRRQPTSLD